MGGKQLKDFAVINIVHKYVLKFKKQNKICIKWLWTNS